MGEDITPEVLSKRADEVVAAQQRFTEATEFLQRASSDQTKALNDLNNAQRHFHDAVIQFKATAPRQTDWHNANHRRPTQESVA